MMNFEVNIAASRSSLSKMAYLLREDALRCLDAARSTIFATNGVAPKHAAKALEMLEMAEIIEAQIGKGHEFSLPDDPNMKVAEDTLFAVVTYEDGAVKKILGLYTRHRDVELTRESYIAVRVSEGAWCWWREYSPPGYEGIWVSW